MTTNKNEESLKYLTAEERLKRLCDLRNIIQIDVNTPARRYYKSGVQMIRMADMYLKEGQLEDAFFLYMKYITLFVEKIREHPDLKSVPPKDISETKHKLKEVLPKAENLKKELLQLYKSDYDNYQQKKRKEEEELLLKHVKQEEFQISENKNIVSEKCKGIRNVPASQENIIKSIPDIDNLSYEILENKLSSLNNAALNNFNKPGVDRSTKPVYNSSNNNYLNSSLRTIIVPTKIIDTFLIIAQKNNAINIETCGILTGKLKQNKLVVTHLLIPKQYGTSDSCTTDNEEDLFNYQNEYNLITLGWIHTHPSQTAFLSSVDLHTHYSYQLMMSEAIAIVCAPRYSETKFFQLTPHYGLNFIANCKQKDFHPHPSDPPLYQEVNHCKLDENANIEVVDLRR